MDHSSEPSTSYRKMTNGEDRPRFFSSLDLPANLSSACNSTIVEDELESPVDGSATEQVEFTQTWELNYNEAAIYLEEGENNDKFDFHPRSTDALPAYLLVHNTWFYILDLLASFMLLFLACMERPSVPGFDTPEGIHGTLELILLGVMCAEMGMKLRWMGFKPFVTHVRTSVKGVVLVVMFIEAIVVLIRQTSHFRITRALRPVFLVDNHFCRGVRRSIRQILQSLPPIIDMLLLLFFFMLVFSVLGFYIFSSNPKDPYFSSLQGTMMSLFVLLTTANYPDVMMPSYSNSRWSAVYFMAFLIVHLYFLMNLMLAVVYETFTTIEKDKFRKLFLHRREACWHAFHLLVNRSSPGKIYLHHFEGLMQFYKPRASKQDVYLMFKTLDIAKNGSLSLEEFYQVYEASSLKWKPKKLRAWYNKLPKQWMRNLCIMVNKLITWKWTDPFINLIIITNGIWQLFEAVEYWGVKNGQLHSYLINNDIKVEDALCSWVTVAFVIFYCLEALLKLIGWGPTAYFESGWNAYDFIVTIAAVAGLIASRFNVPLSIIVILRPLRLLRLFKLKKRYRDVLGTIFILLPRFFSVALILILVYYFFAIIGIELFSQYDMTNCCKNTTIEQYFHYEVNSTNEGYYYLNNFENILVSGVTLFELMVINNWFILMEGYASVSSQWSRIYFMSFYLITMVVLNIVVAFILEAFLFRIQYKRKMGDMDKDSLVRVDISLTRQEYDFANNKGSLGVSVLELITTGDESENILTFRGTRNRTKFSFSLKMYGDEVKEWIEHAEQDYHLRMETILASKENFEDENILEEDASRRTELIT